MIEAQIRATSKLVIDLGKILFAAFVVGFFVPGFSGEVNLFTFLIGGILALTLFVVGIKLTR